MRMAWNGVAIVDLSREFLQLQRCAEAPGRPRRRPAASGSPSWAGTTLAERHERSLVTDLNVASNKGLSERFDSTIGAATVLMPFGGETPAHPELGHGRQAARGRRDHHVHAAMAWGFNPYLMERRPVCWRLHGRGRVRGQARGRRLRATSTPTSPSRSTSSACAPRPERWGKPHGSSCWAHSMAQIDLGVGAIGGKDSMSRLV